MRKLLIILTATLLLSSCEKDRSNLDCYECRQRTNQNTPNQFIILCNTEKEVQRVIKEMKKSYYLFECEKI